MTLALAALLSVAATQADAAAMTIGAPPSTAGHPWRTCTGDPSDDAGGFYPDRAKRLLMSGETTIQCRFASNGIPIACTWISESPAGYDFGQAGARIGCRLKMNPEQVQGAPPEGVAVDIPLHMRVPGE